MSRSPSRPQCRRPRSPLRRLGQTGRVRRIRVLASLAAAAWLLTGPDPAVAVLLASGDGTANTTAPADDPGVAILGKLNGLGALYVGNGWVVTAWHVGEGTVTLGGVDYPHVPGSRTRLTGPTGSPPDVAVMKIAGDPGLPEPVIATTTVPPGTDIVMIGHGKDRGTPLSWMGVDGWNWGDPFTTRWGTNRVTTTSITTLDTRSFEMAFDEIGQPGATSDEAHATLGDSGGAVFWKDGGPWKLAGMMIAVSTYGNQPVKTALFGNNIVAADLSYYRAQILSLTSTPGCSDGLDDDLDGLVDFPADPGCDDASDTSEQSPALECDDGLDNDGDGFIDHTQDPECTSPTAPSEAPSVPAGAAWSFGILTAGLSALGARRAGRTAVPQSSSRTL